eukprot:9484552-Pyramimonas_sp.AAC.2
MHGQGMLTPMAGQHDGNHDYVRTRSLFVWRCRRCRNDDNVGCNVGGHDCGCCLQCCNALGVVRALWCKLDMRWRLLGVSYARHYTATCNLCGALYNGASLGRSDISVSTTDGVTCRGVP